MAPKTEHTSITILKGTGKKARKLGICISHEVRVALKRAMACKGKCPDEPCEHKAEKKCKGSYAEWTYCPCNPDAGW